LAVLRAANVNQPTRVGNARRSLEQQGVGNREDRRVRADADGQRQPPRSVVNTGFRRSRRMA
jgi:hypothetical protein